FLGVRCHANVSLTPRNDARRQRRRSRTEPAPRSPRSSRAQDALVSDAWPCCSPCSPRLGEQVRPKRLVSRRARLPRQNKKLESRSDSIGTELALEPGLPLRDASQQ